MNKIPKILVASPIFKGMKYCLKEFLEGVKNLDYENYQILFVDNSKENDFFEELKRKEGIIVLKDDTLEEKNLKRVVDSRNKIIEYAIINNFDYLFMMDADVIPPKNTLKELLSCGKEVVSGVYYNLFKYSGKIIKLPTVWVFFNEEEFAEFKRVYNTEHKSRFEIKRHLTDEEVKTGKLFEVIYPSAGCMLLKKNIFKKFKYKFEKGSTDEISFLDDIRREKIKIYCNTKIICKHLIEGKRIGENSYHPLGM